MATQPDFIDEPEADDAPAKLSITDILEADNLVDALTANELMTIGQRCLRGFEDDLASRKGDEGQSWDDRYQRYLDIAMQARKAKTFPWPGACYSLDTDVLTDRGWLPVADVRVGDMAYTMDDAGRAYYAPVLAEYRSKSDEMVHFSGKSVDLLVSPNHQMIVADKHGRMEFRRADDIAKQRPTNRYIPLVSEWGGSRPDEMHGLPTRSYMRMLGWFLSEGSSVYAKNTYTTVDGEFRDYGLSPSSFLIAQSPTANPEKCDMIANDISESGLSFKVSTGSSIILHARSMAESLATEFRNLGRQHERYIPREALDLAPDLLTELLDAMVLGDGTTNKRNGHRSYYTISRRLADDVQELCQKIGMRARVSNLGKRDGMIDGRAIIAQHDIYMVSINRKPRAQYQKISIETISAPDTDIACVEVETHRLYVRRNGIAAWCGNSNVKFPILTTAAIQFQARAYPAIVDGSNLVKGRVLGNDNGIPAMRPDGQPIVAPPQSEGEEPHQQWEVPPGAKRARADRIGDHMTWQLLYDMPGWEEDTDRLLLMLPIVGCVFRKTYYDPISRKNCSRMVTGRDFVINYWATCIEEAPRCTQILRFYPHEVEERFRGGVWRTVPLPTASDPHDRSETAPIEFLEQHYRIDLDDDGYPEPYVVTLVRETGDVVRIVPCFDADGVTIDMATMKVIRIEQKRYFTKYGFIPSPDGSFYDIGFGHLLDDITAMIDTTGNQLLDAGALQNTQGGFVGSGVNMRSGDLRFRLGEWKRVDVAGGTLRENIVPLNLPGPSAVLFNLLQMLIGMAKEITSVQDILTGARQGVNTPATTVLAQIEQATKVMTAIFKRIHRSFGQELRILFGLNRDFLDDQAYFALTDAPGEIGRQDYQDRDIDVIPVSDPTMVNDAQRAMKAQALMAFNGDPMTNQIEIRRRYFEGTGQPNVEALMDVPVPPAPPPDPKLLLDAAKQANERQKTLSEIRKNNAAAAASLAQTAQSARDMGSVNDAVILLGAAVTLGTDAADMGDDGEPVENGGVGGMAPEPADGGVLPVPTGPAGGLDGAMGAGGDPFGASAGGGDGLGLPVEPGAGGPAPIL